jgi:hypothetical protein
MLRLTWKNGDFESCKWRIAPNEFQILKGFALVDLQHKQFEEKHITDETYPRWE